MNKKQNIIILASIGFLFSSIMFQNCSSQFNSQSGIPGLESTQYNLANEVDLVRISQKPKNLTNKISETVRYEVISAKLDLIDMIEFQLDADDWKEAQYGEILLTDLVGGNHKISIRAKGKNGSLSAPVEHAWFVDNIRPDIIINMAPTVPVILGSNVDVIYSVVDSQTLTVTCSLNDVPQNSCASPLQFSNLVAGSYSLDLQAIDAAGNEKTEQISFTIVPAVSGLPQILSLLTKPAALSNSPSAQFTFSSSGSGNPLITFQCKLDVESFSSCQSGIQFTGLTDGDHEFSVIGYDSENTASQPVVYQWRIDSVAPIVGFTSLAGRPKETTDANTDYSTAHGYLSGLPLPLGEHIAQFGIADDPQGSGIEKIECQLLKYRFVMKSCNSSLPQQEYINCMDTQYYLGAFDTVKDYFTCASPVDLRDFKGGGVYRLKVKATDKAGNVKLMANEYRRQEGLVGFGSLSLRGGAALVANVIPLDHSKQLLQTYDRLGMGQTSNLMTTTEFGAAWYQGSMMLEGLRQKLNPSDYSKVKVFAISNRSTNDSSSNKFLAHGIIEKLGRSGTYFPVIIDGNNLPQQSAIFPPSVYQTISQSNDLTLRFGIPEQPPHNSLNLLSYPDLAQLWGVNANTYPHDSNMIKGTATLAVLKDHIGTLDFNLGGYDYHNGTRTTGDNRDLEAGILIGKILKTAILMNKPFVLSVTTDGSIRSPKSDLPGGPWTSDHSDGIQLFFVVDIADRFNFSQYMIGSFIANPLNNLSQEVDVENSVAGTDTEKVAAIIACNYAVLSGAGSCNNAINNILTPAEIQQTKVITPK